MNIKFINYIKRGWITGVVIIIVKRVFLLSFLTLFLFCSCVVYPYDERNGSYSNRRGDAYYGISCLNNPYVYHLDPSAWQRWERENYNISCTRLNAGY